MAQTTSHGGASYLIDPLALRSAGLIVRWHRLQTIACDRSLIRSSRTVFASHKEIE
jgi:hypothetical protein